MTDSEFTSKVAVVTGAGSGIGRTVALRLGEAGAVVVALDRDTEAVRSVAKEIRAAGGAAGEVTADVASSPAVTAAVAGVEERYGPIDLLVNVAGVLRMGAATELTDEDWRRTFSVNTDGVFYVSRAVARRMVGRRRGAIVTVASNAARVPRAHMAAYGASKAASSSFTRALGLEVAEHGVRCNVVNPGSTDTPMLRGMWTDDNGLEHTIDGDPTAYRVGIPLRKLGRPEDVADAVVFLLSERAGHITMHELCVDGGASLSA